MRHLWRRIGAAGCAAVVLITLSGCAVSFYKRSPKDVSKIEELSEDLQQLREAKALLEDRLRQEIKDKQVKLDLTDRGLVITFVAEVLFDSGKAKIRDQASSALDQVASVIQEKVADQEIAIEGHTDNVPITHSGWKSNWELSTARATSVLHHLIDKGVNPKRLSAVGYGEHRPIASNDTPEGRQQNRRVEIVILPQRTIKERAQGAPASFLTPKTLSEEREQYIK